MIKSFNTNRFERKLQTLVKQLDSVLPVGTDLYADELAAVIDLCAWTHSEWVRIHPFANGNGRTARLWPNFLAMRYGCRHSSGCGPDPMTVTETPELKRCRATGRQLLRSSGDS